MNANTGQATATHGSIARMSTRLTVAAFLITAVISASVTGAEARQPGCKVLSVESATVTHLGAESPDARYPVADDAHVTTVTTTSRCRGKVVVKTATYTTYTAHASRV